MSVDLLAQFAVQANLLGADVLVVEAADLPETLAKCIDGAGEAGVAIGRELADALPALRPLDTSREDRAQTAVTLGRLMVAGTGTVLLAERDYEDRVLRVTARHHVAVVPAEAIVAGMAEAGPELRRLAGDGRHYATFVSGPSRTADIEKILTIGVHGPERLTICAVSDWRPTDD